MSFESEITLFHWNIVELDDDIAIFVGLYNKLNTDVNIFPYNCGFRSSTAIKSFDFNSGKGSTNSGRHYNCLGQPSDPHKLIRRMVAWHLGLANAKYRYEFIDVNS